MSETTLAAPQTPVRTTARYLPLAGAGYGILQIAGDLTIDKFPDGSTSPQALVDYYATRHAHVAWGGRLMELSAVLLALFAVALWARTRNAGTWSGVVLVGGAMAAVVTATSGATYTLLGDISTGTNLDPAALQSWHLAGSEFGTSAGMTVMMIGVLMASLTSRAIPVWLGWTGLALGLAGLTPVAFLASMLTLLWCLVAGVVLAARPRP